MEGNLNQRISVNIDREQLQHKLGIDTTIKVNKLLQENAKLQIENFELKTKLNEYQKKIKSLETQLKNQNRVSGIQIIDKSSLLNASNYSKNSIINPMKNQIFEMNLLTKNSQTNNSNNIHIVKMYDMTPTTSPLNIIEEKPPLLMIRKNNLRASIQLQCDPQKFEELSAAIIMPEKPRIMQSQIQENVETGRLINGSFAVWDSNTDIKQSLKMSKPLNEPAKFVNTKPFEGFYIIGVEKNDLILLEQKKVFQSQLPLKEKLLPKYLYSFPRIDDNNPEIRGIIDFFFPHGVKVTQEATDTQCRIPEIIFSQKVHHIHENCFVFPLESTMMYDSTIKVDSLLDESNPIRNRYFICVKTDDYQLSSGSKTMWVTEKVYCFITFYPLISFFLDLISKILDNIKYRRTKKLATFSENDKHYDQVDSNFAISIVSSAIEEGLRHWSMQAQPKFDDYLTVNLFLSNLEESEFVMHKVVSKDLAYTLECSWALSIVFNYLSLKDLLFIFTAVITEKKVIILSKDMALLTGTLYTLLCLLKPFKYSGKLVFLLPEALLIYIEAIGCNLYGINKGESYLFEEKIFNVHDVEGCIFVCLDERHIYTQKEIHEDISFPLFKEFESTLQMVYQNINPQKNYTFHVLRINQAQKERKKTANVPKEKKYDFDGKTQHYCFKILQIFQDFFRQRIINHLPSKAIYKDEESKKLDLSAIAEFVVKSNNDPIDRFLLNKLKENQTFMYFIQEHYEKKGA